MADRMPRDLPKYVTAERDRHGKVRIYFRRAKDAPRIAMPDPRNKSAFDAAYAEALAGNKPKERESAAPASLAWLIARYMESAQWRALAPETRRYRSNVLHRMKESAGNATYSDITGKHIAASMAKRTPHAANNFRKAAQGLFSWAENVGLVSANPVAKVAKIKARTVGFHTWTLDEIERFRAHYPLGTRERLAMEIGLFVGLRRGDVHRLGRQHIRDGVMSIQTSKTKTWVHVPVFRQLQDAIDAMPVHGLPLMTTSRGMPFTSAASFGTWFAKACQAAGVPGRMHGLRKIGATIAANNGATVHELMAMYGWTRPEQAMVYTQAAERKVLARSAAERIANADPRTGTRDPRTEKKA